MFKEILEKFGSLRYWFKNVYRNNKEEPEKKSHLFYFLKFIFIMLS